MKKVALLLLLMTVSASLFALSKVTRNLESYHELQVFGNVKLTLVQSDTLRVTLSSDLVDVGKVSTKIEKGELKIRSNAIGDEKEVLVTLYFKSLDRIGLDGGANLVTAPVIEAENLHLRIVKGSLMRAPLKVKNLTVIVLHGANVWLKGDVDFMDATVSSGAMLDTDKTKLKKADILATTGGKIFLTVIEEIKARAKLGGSIQYKGNPKKESVDPSTGGTITKG